MQNNTMFPDWLYGMFGRVLPDFDEPIVSVMIETCNYDVTEKKVRALANEIMGEDGVAVPENFLDDAAEGGFEDGQFKVHIQEAYLDTFVEKYRAKPVVSSIETRWLGCISKYTLARHFPEEMSGRYFCSACDFEKENELDPCGNGGCYKGLQNFKGIQETNAALEAQVRAMESDVQSMVSPMVEAMEGAMTQNTPTFMGFMCPECECLHPRNQYIDQDGDFDCDNDCGYFQAEENKYYE